MNQTGRTIIAGVVQEPMIAQGTRSFGRDDALSLHSQVNVVAHAATKSAGGVIDDVEAHKVVSMIL